MKIYKYKLQITDGQIIDIPNLREVISVQIQDGEPVLWVIVDDEFNLHSSVNIFIVGTGNEFEDYGMGARGTPRNYLSTFQAKGFVGHVFYSYGIE